MATVITNAQILAEIRELTFDKFVTPTFFVAYKNPTGITTYPVVTTYNLKIDALGVYLYDNTTLKASWLFTAYKTLQDIVTAIAESGQPIELIYSGSFIPSEPSNSLRPIQTTLDMWKPVFRKYYFSDEYIERYYMLYGMQVLCATCKDFADPIDWDAEFADPGFDCRKHMHFVLWVGYQLVGQRRLYELANSMLLQSSNGGVPGLNGPTTSVGNSSFSLTTPGESLTINVGDVWTLNEDETQSLNVQNGGQTPEGMIPPWGIGSDNVLMDYYSFWYRLQLWIRQLLEDRFHDYSLRRDTMLQGNTRLDKKENYWAYFDAYPWTFSPYLRGVPNVDLIGQSSVSIPNTSSW